MSESQEPEATPHPQRSVPQAGLPAFDLDGHPCGGTSNEAASSDGSASPRVKKPDADLLVRQARFLLDLGKAADSLKVLQKLVDWYPEHVEAWCLTARAFFLLDDDFRAKKAAEMAIQADPHGTDGYAWMCRLLAYASQWKPALEVVEKGLEMTYRDPVLQQWRVRLLMADERRSEALRDLSLQPRNTSDPGWAYLWGESERRIMHFREAEAHYQTACLADPASSDAWSGLATVQLAQRRVPEAVGSITRAIQVSGGAPDLAPRTLEVFDLYLMQRVHDPVWLSGVVFMAVALVMPGWFKLAAFPVGAGTFLAARSWNRRRRKELLLKEVGAEIQAYYEKRKAKAVKDQLFAGALGWGCLLVPILLAILVVSLNGSIGWLNVLRCLLVALLAVVVTWTTLAGARGPKEPLLPFRFPGDGFTHEELERTDLDPAIVGPGAVGEQEPVEVWHPNLLWLSKALLNAGKLEPARARAREAVASDPEDPEALAQLSVTLLVLGEHEDGASAAKAILARHPNHAKGHGLLWAHLAAAGRSEEAVAAAQDAGAERVKEAGSTLVDAFRWVRWNGSDQAAEALQSLVRRLYAGDAEPYLVEGNWALHSRRMAEAEAAFRQGLALNPESAELHAGMAMALACRWRLRKAAAAARRALALDPSQTYAREFVAAQADRVPFFLLVGAGAVVMLCAALPTLLGAPSNSRIALFSLLLPVATGTLAAFSTQLARKILAPGLQLGSALDAPPDSTATMGQVVLCGTATALVCLTVHSLQAWLEILLHQNLFPARWPGAATVTALAAFLGWLAWINLRNRRR